MGSSSSDVDPLGDVWVVIHCESDDSHNLVDLDDIIFEGSIHTGDEVKFQCPGYKDLLTGTVKGKSKNKRKMVKLQDQLNRDTKPRRETSFHEGDERQAKVKCRTRIGGSQQPHRVKPNSATKSAATSPELEHRSTTGSDKKSSEKPTPRHEMDASSDEDDDDSVKDKDYSKDSDGSSSTEEELTTEERNLLEKLKRKKKFQDFQSLRGFKLKILDAPPAEESRPNYKPVKTSVGPAKTPRHDNMTRPVKLINFEGQQLQFSSTDEKVVKLWPDIDNIFISERDMKKAKRQFTSATALARALIRMTFTPEARQSCSVSGKPSLVRGSTVPEKRTALEADGVEAILEFVNDRALKKGWKAASNSFLKQAMANLLCEERSKVTV